MGAAAHSGSGFLPRGVWKGPYPRDGSPTAIAVDSSKRCLGEIVLHPGIDTQWVRRVLTELVDMADPISQLAIVREDTAKLPRWPKREGEPTGLSGLSAAATLLLYRKP